MKKTKPMQVKYWPLLLLLSLVFLTAPLSTAWSHASSVTKKPNNEYVYWKRVGAYAARTGYRMLQQNQSHQQKNNWLVLTNAGYAEVNNRTTMGALDGLTRVLRVRRGNHSLVELQSPANAPLWFAVYDKSSGWVAYLEVNPAAVQDQTLINRSNLFSTRITDQINAEHLYEHALEYVEKFDNKIFNGNAFRIVTVANALQVGAPTTAVRAFEIHDHYCPGVSSGVIMAEYIKKYFPTAPDTRYFVQAIQPWCKEDALMVLLNATPGKRSYSATYPSQEDIASWPTWAQKVSTVVYRYNKETELWEGLALEYVWEETGCSDYGHSVMNKLCADLWYLDHLEQPESFIRVLKRFNLPQGSHPKEYARPGVDPIFLLGYWEELNP